MAAKRVERDVAAIDAKIARLVRAIEDGDGARSLVGRLAELEAERDAIRSSVPLTVDDNVLSLHPTAARRYAEQVATIGQALSRGDEAAQEAIALVRKLISAIIATPTDDGGPMRLEVTGDLAVMLDQAGASDATVMAVSGSRYHRSRHPYWLSLCNRAARSP